MPFWYKYFSKPNMLAFALTMNCQSLITLQYKFLNILIWKVYCSSIALLTKCISSWFHRRVFYWANTDHYCFVYCALGNTGLIQAKEEEWTGFSEDWQGCSEGFLEDLCPKVKQRYCCHSDWGRSSSHCKTRTIISAMVFNCWQLYWQTATVLKVCNYIDCQQLSCQYLPVSELCNDLNRPWLVPFKP